MRPLPQMFRYANVLIIHIILSLLYFEYILIFGIFVSIDSSVTDSSEELGISALCWFMECNEKSFCLPLAYTCWSNRRRSWICAYSSSKIIRSGSSCSLNDKPDMAVDEVESILLGPVSVGIGAWRCCGQFCCSRAESKKDCIKKYLLAKIWRTLRFFWGTMGDCLLYH